MGTSSTGVARTAAFWRLGRCRAHLRAGDERGAPARQGRFSLRCARPPRARLQLRGDHPYWVRAISKPTCKGALQHDRDTEPRMTDMIELVEEMRAKIGQIAGAEEELMGSLREVLSRVDDKLLQDVRTITTDHEARRGHSLRELRHLASRIGTFPTAHA